MWLKCVAVSGDLDMVILKRPLWTAVELVVAVDDDLANVADATGDEVAVNEALAMAMGIEAALVEGGKRAVHCSLEPSKSPGVQEMVLFDHQK